jgi:hypothetical protein
MASSHQCIHHESSIFASDFLNKVDAFISVMHAVCPAALISIDLVTLIIFGKVYSINTLNKHRKLMYNNTSLTEAAVCFKTILV